MVKMRVSDMKQEYTAGEMLEMIRSECRDEFEKGDKFEKLWRKIILGVPDFEVEDAWQWKNWPDRTQLTNLPYDDTGIDIVARLKNGKLVAIQCKCQNEDDYVNRDKINSFLAVSGEFDMRWIVATCRWGKNAESVIEDTCPPTRRIDFHLYDDVKVSVKGEIIQKKRRILPLQVNAINNVVTRLSTNTENRGQLIMACGTGKTYTSLRISEKLAVDDNSNILFLAPSIALVSQARREWLRHTERLLNGLVVCSDSTSGGRNESDDIRVSELECAVTTEPEKIAKFLKSSGVKVTFCTYQSLEKVSDAQFKFNAPEFDLLIADEAHCTTGIKKNNGFHILHDDHTVLVKKRLYMTATQRIHDRTSKTKIIEKGYDVYDMNDPIKFGEVLSRLTFKEAVNSEEKMLSDYKVVVSIVRDDKMIRDLYDKYVHLTTESDKEVVMKYEDVERLVGTVQAINGISNKLGAGVKMPRVLGFANTRKRSKAFTQILNMPDLHKILVERLQDPNHSFHKVEHIDGKSPAYERNRVLDKLGKADESNPLMVMNVKLFTEGVDVPSLSAAAFLDPRDSMVDIVQAVGRVMRKAEGKQFGYIIIPVPVKNDINDIAGELEAKDGWKATGRVLRALQSHDGRLPENPLQFIDVLDPGSGGGYGEDGDGHSMTGFQDRLEFEQISEALYSKVIASSGLAKPGQMVTDEIAYAVEFAGNAFQKYGDLDVKLAGVLGLDIDGKQQSLHACKTASLLIINACLLHRRLQDKIDGLPKLGDINGGLNPHEDLSKAWNIILDKDYAPIFKPALSVVNTLPKDESLKGSLYRIIDSADAMADTLGELGYDHAGPLYHKILGTAKSDSANYTDNVSAIMLARLAIPLDFVSDWSDIEKITNLRIMDPACGTGTLLMATLRTIKDRMNYDDLDEYSRTQIHSMLVENSLYGLDINHYAVQLAACNLTLGAPTIDYRRMNLHTMIHGPQPNGSVAAGSVEILKTENERDNVKALVQPLTGKDLNARHVDNSTENGIPTENLDVVIMNPPYGNNKVRGRKFSARVVKEMQKNERDIKSWLANKDVDAAEAISSNSISTFFTPLADRLLNTKHGTLAKILPTIACSNVSGLPERKFYADRFHVECVISSHDPKHLSFSYKTNIHESLMICRRYDGDSKPPTNFMSLHRMPKNIEEAIEATDAIISGDVGKWGSMCTWPSERVLAGDWSPAQWFDTDLAEIILNLEDSPLLEALGVNHDVGPRIDASYEKCGPNDTDAINVFESIGTNLRKTIHNTTPDVWYKPLNGKKQLAIRHWERRSNLLVATRFSTTSTRLTAICAETPTLGTGYIHTAIQDIHEAKALCVWWNSTPAILMLLNGRGKKMTYPHWKLDHLRGIRIPKPDNPCLYMLRDAYDKICDVEIQPLKHAAHDSTRAIMDEAAAKCLNVEESVITDWRRRLSKEPTINNEYTQTT